MRCDQGFDLVFGGVLDHFLARETALARPDMPLAISRKTYKYV